MSSTRRANLLSTTAPARTRQAKASPPPRPGKAPIGTAATRSPASLAPISADARATQEDKTRRARPPKTAPPDADNQTDAMSITTFCQRHGISRSFYFLLQQQGRGPKVFELGSRTLISKEAAADWRRQQEEATKLAPRPKRPAPKRHRAAPSAAATAI
jgi:hypothetical protein